MDEVHFQQYGSRCRMWIPPDLTDPVLRHYPGRKSVGYFGAVRLDDGRFVYRRESNGFNAQTCLDFLKQLERTSVRRRNRVVVIADNARYHHVKLHRDWRQARAKRFALDFLPPYSPDLNPIERVWKLVRLAVCACIIAILAHSLQLQTVSKKCSISGRAVTMLSDDYAQLLKALCINPIMWLR